VREEFDKDAFIGMVKSGDLEFAKVAILSVVDYHPAEYAVFAAFESEAPAELVEFALKKFMGTHEACEMKPYHGYWVHSLSHFTVVLWQRRMTDWIKKFNEIAFAGAIKHRDSNCSNRLVDDFGEYALWSDAPGDFLLTPDNLQWMDWKYARYAKARIEVGSFSSETDCLRWRLGLPKENQPRWNDFGASDVVRLKEFDANISAFVGPIREQLTARLAEYEGKVASATVDHQRAWAQKYVDETHVLLAKLS
jgi:hypothetical protein